MARTETLHVRLEPNLRASVEDTLHNLGLSASEAVNIFFHQILLHGGLPFPVQAPRLRAETLAALKESDAIASGQIAAKTYHSAEELIREAKAEVSAED